ncbi:MAG TPA: NAD(P)-binding domain-containing protein [Chloroflexota bacterium]|nr:NAD(P)-binding domain-containing protein [Chloroflexota bacterium]
MADKIGFIGLGTMGRPFATNIVRAGFDLTVYDVQPQPVNELVKLGARAARSAREVADLVDIVDIAVPHEAEVDAVLQGPDGLLAGAHPGLIAAIHSSIHPLHMMRVAEEARAHGVEVLDAQMSGGAGGVTSQTLCLMVGGDPAVLERCRPVLETTAGNIFLLGKVGMGAVTKIAQNTMTAEYLMAATEGFRLAERAGVDLEVFQEVVRTSSAQSHVADEFLHGRGTRDASWVYYHVLRDALDLGQTYDVTLPGAATCMQALAHSLRKG